MRRSWLNKESGPHQNLTAGALVSDFPASKMVSDEFLLFISHPSVAFIIATKMDYYREFSIFNAIIVVLILFVQNKDRLLALICSWWALFSHISTPSSRHWFIFRLFSGFVSFFSRNPRPVRG